MGEERNKYSTRHSDPYTESRRLWKEYKKGRISADELARCLGEHTKGDEIEKVRDLFNGKDCC